MTYSWIGIVLLAIFVTACTGAQKENKEEAQLRLKLGTSLLTQGQYPAALAELLKAEALDPDDASIQNNLGIAYFVRDKFDEAETHLRKALKILPTYTDARNNLARVLIEKSQYEQAIGELEKVLSDLTYQSPDKAWVNLGLAYFRKGQYQTAKAKFAEAIKLNRQHCLGQTLYGRSLLELGEFQLAATSLDNAVSICGGSQYDEPHYYSGLSYYKLGQTTRALARMEEVIKLYPEGKFAKKAQSLIKLMR